MARSREVGLTIIVDLTDNDSSVGSKKNVMSEVW